MIETFLVRTGLKKDTAWSQFVFRWLTIGLVLHLIAAVRSKGFYHADEHFQIIEFMNFKLGRSVAKDLPLEYNHLLRPWLFPAILYELTRFLSLLGIDSPFKWALSYRAFSAVLGWLSTAGLSLCCYTWFVDKNWRKWAVFALNFLWFIPALHARHSSENLGGSVFFIGLSFLVLTIPAQTKPPAPLNSLSFPIAFLTGILFGFAFEFRYQVAFMILGALLWLMVFARIPWRQYLPVLWGFLIPFALGTIADRWGYGQWTFVPWNYVKYNLIQNHVADMDTSPWWDYFRRSFTESWPFLGFLVLLSFPIAWIRNPKHILTWSMVPFFLIHELIGHKELRFLFPLAHAAGILLIWSILPLRKINHWPVPQVLQHWKPQQWKSRLVKISCWPVRVGLGFNLIALLILTVIPAWMPIRFYERLYHFHPYQFQVDYINDSLFNFGGAIMNFYRSPDLPLVSIKNFQELKQKIQNHPEPVWFFNPHASLPEEAGSIKAWCKIEFSTLPVWFNKLNYSHLSDRITNWTLFRCESPDPLKINLFKSLNSRLDPCPECTQQTLITPT